MSPLQRRAFLVGSWAMIVTAGLHALGNLEGLPPPADVRLWIATLAMAGSLAAAAEVYVGRAFYPAAP